MPVIGGAPRKVTDGPFDEHSLTWAPDSRQIAFVSNRSDDPDNNFSDDLWIVKIVGSEIEQLTSTRGAEFHPRWSPDGSRIAYLAMSRELNSKDSPAENARLYILPSAGGQRRAMTGQDDHVINFEWHPDSNSLHFVTRAEGAHPLSRVKIETNTIDHILRGNFQVFEFDSDATGEFLVYSRTDMTHPADLWTSSSAGEGSQQLTRVNESFMRRIAVQDADTFWFESFDKTKIQGWLLNHLS